MHSAEHHRSRDSDAAERLRAELFGPSAEAGADREREAAVEEGSRTLELIEREKNEALREGQRNIAFIAEEDYPRGRASGVKIKIDPKLYAQYEAVRNGILRAANGAKRAIVETFSLSEPPLEADPHDFEPDPEGESGGVSERFRKAARLKREIAGKRESLALLQADLQRILAERPGAGARELLHAFDERTADLHLSKEQAKIAHDAIREYSARHRAVRHYREKYPDDAELFLHVFGRRPEGPVEVVEGPMTLYFRCFNLEDYAYATSERRVMGELQGKVTAAEMEAARHTGGMALALSRIRELDGTITVENSRGNLDLATFLHEEQHQFYRLFPQALPLPRKVLWSDIAKADSAEEKRRMLHGIFRDLRTPAERAVKNELLAYFTNPDGPPKNLAATLTKKDGFYDFIDVERIKQMADSALGKEERGLIEETAEKVFGSGYRRLIMESIQCFNELRAAGWPKEEVIALLTHEPLAKWPRAARHALETRESPGRS